MTDVSTHCWDSMRRLEGQYLQGKGAGDILECSFLTYLEVAEVTRGADPARVWEGWAAILVEKGDGGPLNRHLGNTVEARRALVDALNTFAVNFSLPRRQAFNPPEIPASKARSEDYNLLFGDT